MSDDKPKMVEARPLTYCDTHKEGVLELRDEAGNTHLQAYRHVDPDFPLPEGPLLQVNGAPSQDGWFQGKLTTQKGPTKVNSDAYRKGWERIFGNKVPEGEA